MNFDSDAVVKTMVQAAVGPLHKYWKTAGPIVESELKNIAQLVEQIGIERATGTVTKADAQDRLAMAKDAAECAIDTQIGLATIASEDAINAALGSVSSIINGYVGLVLV